MPRVTVEFSPKGFPDRQHIFPDLQFGGIAPGDRGKVLSIDLHDGEIRFRIGSDDLASEFPFVR